MLRYACGAGCRTVRMISCQNNWGGGAVTGLMPLIGAALFSCIRVCVKRDAMGYWVRNVPQNGRAQGHVVWIVGPEM